jgi:NitT/TauT family transport system substrate-binding protein
MNAVQGVLFGAVMALGLTGAARAADDVAVGIGGSASDAPLFIAQHFGYFKDEGLNVKLIMLDSGAKTIAPLGTGELDVGSGALSVGFYNALARDVHFKIVADRGHTNSTSLYQTVFIRKDLIDSGQFKELKDLAGKKIGFAAPGVTALSLLNQTVKKAGIPFDSVTPVFLGFAAQAAAMQNKGLDGSFLIEPQATQLVKAGVGVRFMNTNEIYPNEVISTVFYSEKFSTQRAPVAVKFMKAWLRAVRTYTDAMKDGRLQGPGADKIVKVLAEELRMDPSIITAMYPAPVDPDGKINVESLKTDLAFFKSKGWVTGDIDLDKVVDPSFAQKAGAELGPYKPKTE